MFILVTRRTYSISRVLISYPDGTLTEGTRYSIVETSMVVPVFVGGRS